MANDYLPAQDALLEEWFTNFLTVAADNLTELGLTTAQLNALDTANSQFSTNKKARAG